ncbi:MAG TPA: condensation domain-containing protein, partial [Thermoanaerobaculia bacterium]
MEARSETAAELDAKRQRLLSALLAEQGLAASAAPILPLSRERTTFPLSFAQERLWVTMQLDPVSTAYNLRTALLLDGDLSVPVLARTLSEVARRHQTLRTTYRLAAGRPVQVVALAADVPVPVVDLTALPPARIDGLTHALSREARARPFDLERGPVVRLLLVRRAAREHA